MQTLALTDASVIEDDHQTGIVNPLDPEPSHDVLPLGERRLDVLRLQLLRKASQAEDAGDGGGERGELGGHV